MKKPLLIVAGLLTITVAALAVAVALLLPGFVRARVIEAAAERGISIEPGPIGFGWGWAQVSDAKLSLTGVHGFTAHAAIIDVELRGLVPQRFTVSQLQAQVVLDPTSLARELEAWRGAHQKSFVEPAFVKPFVLSARSEPGSAAFLEIQGGELDSAKERLSLRAQELLLKQKRLGAFSFSTENGSVHLGLTLGKSALHNPLLTIDVDDKPARSVHVALSPITLGDLGSALNFALPLAAVKVGGTVDLVLPEPGAKDSRVRGRADFTLKGYVPPHPVELDGFVFGDTTRLGARFAIEPLALLVRIEQAEVQAGRFELKGPGELRILGDDGRLTLSLSGQLPCAALVAASAETRLGRALGRVAGKAARETLTGVVGIRVAVDAALHDLAQARALKTITPGCGLKPLTLAELSALGELLPEMLDPQMARDFETLLKSPLPPLPNLGPDTRLNLPNLNQLPLPQLSLPQVPGTKAPATGSKAPSTATKAPAKTSPAPSAAH